MIWKLHLYLPALYQKLFLVLGCIKYTFSLRPSHWINVKTKGCPKKVLFLGRSNRLASLDDLNNLHIYNLSKDNDQIIK